MKEVWKDIKGFENLYQVSNFGRVKSFNKFKAGHLLKLGINKAGYRNIALSFKGKRKMCSVGNLVAFAFLLKFKDDIEVNHKDGDKENNHVFNLEWVTHSANIRHAYNTGLMCKKGEMGGKVILNNRQVRVIKYIKNIPNHISAKIVGEVFGVKQNAIYEIWGGRNWSHITI